MQDLQQMLDDPALISQALEMAWPVITSLALAFAILAVGWMASKWANRTVTRALRTSNTDEALARFLGTVAGWAVLAVTLVGALGRLGIATSSLLTVLASAGLAIGLALKGTLGNFASGVVLLVFRPFHIDDIIEVGGVSGTVVDIGLWATTLHAFDGGTIVLPNGDLTDSVIVNNTRRGMRRVSVAIGVEYGSDLDEVRSVLQQAATQVELALDDPAPDVRFDGFGASSVNFEVLLWVDAENYVAGTQSLSDRIYRSLDEADIGIPFNQLVLRQAEALEVASLQNEAVDEAA